MAFYALLVRGLAFWAWLVVISSGSILAQSLATEDETESMGFLFDEFDLTLTLGTKTEAAGPFYYKEEQGPLERWGIPPLFTYTKEKETDYEEFALLYPLVTRVRYGEAYRWHIGQLFSFAGGPSGGETNRDRFTLFPFYFQQRGSDTNRNYTAFFPFYGHLENRLFRDEIDFVMFPAYGKTRKKDVVTENYFYPFYHKRYGDGLKGWQIWPFYGREHKDVTTKTNMFKEPQTVAGHDKTFIMWPIYFDVESGIGSANPSKERVLLPAFYSLRSPRRDQTTVLWPLFSDIDDREKHYRERHRPWPLVVYARGEGKTTSRVFPFYSHAQNTNLTSDFVMWPIYKYNRVYAPPLDRERTRIAFFLYSDLRNRDTESGAYWRRVDFWPFFTHRRDLNGNSRLQVLAPLEPLLPENPNIAREYAPVYSLWRHEKNANTGAESQSLLWNLYRRDKNQKGTKISFFFGLYQSRSDTEGNKRVKLFFIPLNKSKSRVEEEGEKRDEKH